MSTDIFEIGGHVLSGMDAKNLDLPLFSAPIHPRPPGPKYTPRRLEQKNAEKSMFLMQDTWSTRSEKRGMFLWLNNNPTQIGQPFHRFINKAERVLFPILVM